MPDESTGRSSKVAKLQCLRVAREGVKIDRSTSCVVVFSVPNPVDDVLLPPSVSSGSIVMMVIRQAIIVSARMKDRENK